MSEFDIPATPAGKAVTTNVPKMSRQARRHRERQAAKAFRRHQNENVMGRNKPRSGDFGFLNRAQYRKFLSKRCPEQFGIDVLNAVAERAVA